MANLRIRELDNVSVGGDDGTSADAVYIVVDPASGGTGKVSLESAVAGTDVIANAASSLGAPLIWSGISSTRGGNDHPNGNSVVKNNIFALGTTVFGTISWGGSTTATISKSKGATVVLVFPVASYSRTISQGTPSGGELNNDKQFRISKLGGILDLEAHTNGLKFKFSSRHPPKFSWNFMYWPTS